MQFFDDIRAKRILVLGDLMLDKYLWGRVERISPEAPVPVVDVQKEEYRLGGAANVAYNLLSLGADPILCGIIGTEPVERSQFLELMNTYGLQTGGLLSLPHRPTTSKTRVLGDNQQMLRVDRENKQPLTAEEEAQMRGLLDSQMALLPAAIILEDYNKGLLTPGLIRHVVQQAVLHDIPVLVDPKYTNFLAYGGSTIFKPNLKELNEALALTLSREDIPAIVSACALLQQRMPHRYTFVTLSEQGVLLVDAAGHHVHFPAHVRKIRDVSGAGDTVISVMAAALAAGLPAEQAAALANLAGGLVCEIPGVAPIDPLRLRQEAQAILA
ncbi:MAG: PfkB family carbohydrate kinase [Bacteroidetes bacterium]|nr:PfkB family carbohydrate kinase [Bacteroidota bacterium]